ncbi:hypothetical protein [Paraburkholderia sp.]|uniref:hypothetical protein n=1 Tax=Paraburkholderia sp. TaxID=1926495 RepID=UPI003D6ED384
MATKKIPALRIVPTTGRDSYRAIGRVFGRKATDIAVADLSKAQIEKLKSDPWLSVSEVQVDEIVPDDAGDDTGSTTQ